MSSTGGGPSGSGNGNGQKRGRDRSCEEAGPSNRPSKTPRKSDGGSRKKREEFIDQVESRPENLDKSGNRKGENRVVKLKANFFKVNFQRGINVTLYRVDFDPEVQIRGIKNRLIYQHKEMFGCFSFDGDSLLYLLSPLRQPTIELQSADRDGNNFTLRLRMTREIRFTEATFLSVLGSVMRNAMRGLDLQLIGRNFFDAVAKVSWLVYSSLSFILDNFNNF